MPDQMVGKAVSGKRRRRFAPAQVSVAQIPEQPVQENPICSVSARSSALSRLARNSSLSRLIVACRTGCQARIR